MLSKYARKRLIAAHRDLSLKERQIREMLGLRFQPGLSLLDESSATYLTAEDRHAFDRKERDRESRDPEAREREARRPG